MSVSPTAICVTTADRTELVVLARVRVRSTSGLREDFPDESLTDSLHVLTICLIGVGYAERRTARHYPSVGPTEPRHDGALYALREAGELEQIAPGIYLRPGGMDDTTATWAAIALRKRMRRSACSAH